MTPVPTTSDSYILRYIPALTKYTVVADDMILDEEYEQMLNSLLESMYEAWKRSPSTVFADSRVIEDLNALLDSFSPEAHVFDIWTNDTPYM